MMKSREAQFCNIGGREIAKRRWFGIAMVIVGIALESGFVLAAASRWWRLALFPILYLAISGILQAHGAT
jgi:hypothetical protein